MEAGSWKNKLYFGDNLDILREHVQDETVSVGFYEPKHFPGHQYPRIQILTIKELLEGKEAQYSRMAPPATFKRAQRHRTSIEDQQKFTM